MRNLYKKLLANTIALLLLCICAPKLSAQPSMVDPIYIMLGVSMNGDYSDRTSWIGFYNWEGYQFNLDEPGVYTLNNVEFHDTNGHNQCEFMVSHQHGSYENLITTICTPSSTDTSQYIKTTEQGVEYQVIKDTAKRYNTCSPGTYNVKLLWNGLSGTLYLTKPHISTGIGTLEADNTDPDAIYYDITGRQVTTPKSGIYLCRKGNKVTKVVIR